MKLMDLKICVTLLIAAMGSLTLSCVPCFAAGNESESVSLPEFVESSDPSVSGNTLPEDLSETRPAEKPEMPAGASDAGVTDGPSLPDGEGDFPELSTSAIERFLSQFDETPVVRSTAEEILELTGRLDPWFRIPMFRQIVYALGIAGAVSFTFQLMFTKIIVLLNGGFSIREVLSDLTGLIFTLSVVLLTLRGTDSAPGFSGHAGMVTGLTLVGIIAGMVHYRWAQRQEILAARGQHAGGKRRRSQ